MTMDSDLREKLEDARATLADLVVRLQAYESLAEALDSANNQLRQTAGDTSELVKSAGATQVSLAQTLEKIQGVMDVLSQLDPAPVISRVEIAQTSIAATVADTADRVSTAVQEHTAALHEAVTSGNESTREHVDTVASAISAQRAQDAKFLKIVGVATLLAAGTAAVISVLAVVSP